MADVEVLFFDVLGTMVDWRGSISAEVKLFLGRHGGSKIDASAFADSWVGRYDGAVDLIRTGQRSYVPLDVVNMETLHACLAEFGLDRQALSPAELDELNRAWHRLRPWPDARDGLRQLRQHFIVTPLSDGQTRLLVNVSKHSGLSWDTVVGSDITRAYKPKPEVYMLACSFLGVAPSRAMLVAAHDYDLAAARRCGFKTAYIRRENAADPSKAGEAPQLDHWDYTASDLVELASILGAHPAHYAIPDRVPGQASMQNFAVGGNKPVTFTS